MWLQYYGVNENWTEFPAHFSRLKSVYKLLWTFWTAAAVWWYLLCFRGLQSLMTVYELQFLSYVIWVWSRCALLLNKQLWWINEPTSLTSAKLWNLVSAPCLVCSCTAHKNKQAPSTKSALHVHIKYLYNSKLFWDSFSPFWNCQSKHKDARLRHNRRQWNCLQTCE